MKTILTLICTSIVSNIAFGYEIVYDISNNGLDMIKEFESFEPKPYFDHKAYSIGYGVQRLCNGKKVTAKTKPMNEEQATKELKCVVDVKNDLLIAYYYDNKMEISQEMHDSLLSFTYNLGSYAALRSSVFKHLHKKNCFAAYESMLSYNKASGQVLKGLTLRRQKEANQLIEGCKKVNQGIGYEFYKTEKPKKTKIKKVMVNNG